MEHQKCYVYKQSKERSTKRRRVEPSGLQSSWKLREQIYGDLWTRQEQQIQDVLSSANAVTFQNITDFVVSRSKSLPLPDSKIPTGLVLAGPSIASHGPFFKQLSVKISDSCQNRFILLSSGECPNLKTLLKVLIRKATARPDDNDDDELVKSSRRGPKVLNFDLKLLHDWLHDHSLQPVVVVFQDSEAFDGSLLVETVELLHTWSNRIPFVLLFGVATSLDNFHAKLSRAALRCLSGEQFDVAQSQEVLERVFWTSVAESSLRLGAGLSAELLERQKDHIQSVQAFATSLKYAYMSHFYANPLSVFLHSDLQLKDINTDHIEAARNLPSFRSAIKDLLERQDAATVRSLLDSDANMLSFAKSQLEQSAAALQNIISACECLNLLRGCIPSLQQISLSTLYIKAMSSQLASSPTVREFLLAFKKASSDLFLQIINLLIEIWGGDANAPQIILDIRIEVEELVSARSGPSSTPLRSQHDIRNDTIRTTVVAQKVELRKQKASLSKEDQKYSDLLTRFHDQLAAYFESALIDVKQLFGHEILLYDIKAPQRAVFSPKPRFIVERALSIPHDYLACECCPAAAGRRGDESTLSGTQPATAILYQLYLESGSLINASDLWSAFFAIVGDEGGEEAPVMAQFQGALAELKYLGFLKPSRKKADHVAKVLWKGL